MEIRKFSEYFEAIDNFTSQWKIKADPWFRGENCKPNKPYWPLLPKIFFPEYKNRENEIIQMFRMKAPNYGDVPEFSRTDLWLFLMQHCGLPTRLLDWTEGSLIALFFAINECENGDKPFVYILNPLLLNYLTFGELTFDLTWIGYKAEFPVRIGNISAAFTREDCPFKSDYPVAIYPHSIHPRITAQHGCFTVHGNIKESIDTILKRVKIRSIFDTISKEKLFESSKRFDFKNLDDLLAYIQYSFDSSICLGKIEIVNTDIEYWQYELKMMGISYSTLFPDLDGLAREIRMNKSRNMY